MLPKTGRNGAVAIGTSNQRLNKHPLDKNRAAAGALADENVIHTGRILESEYLTFILPRADAGCQNARLLSTRMNQRIHVSRGRRAKELPLCSLASDREKTCARAVWLVILHQMHDTRGCRCIAYSCWCG